jgi:glyoxalase family protein
VKLLGIHHITAIATDPQRNLDFYTQVLGLRLVKRTVNFDDPGTYHLYFGDGVGTPGTIITFFPWPGAHRGSRGTSQVVATSFAIPEETVDYWKSRFKDHHIVCEEAPARFGDAVLRVTDPDGLLLELITSNVLENVSLDFRDEVPAKFAIQGFHAPTLELQSVRLTEELITSLFGFQKQAEAKNRGRFSLDSNSTSHQLDLVERPDGSFGNIAAGTVHHIAFRAANDEEQQRWRENLSRLGLNVTPIIDRQYFHSIYFREPGGILFEIATDPPGFTIDEPRERLGQTLKLPQQFESHRAAIERRLPPISVSQKAARE